MPKQLIESQIDAVAQLFGVLSDPTRLKILHALFHGPQTVSELVSTTELKQANVSKHLGVLFQCGLVHRKKMGTSVQYGIVDERVFQVCATVCDCLREKTKEQYDCLCAKSKR